MSLPSKPSRIDFDNIDSRQIQRILKANGKLESLTPAERSYFEMMELVRGLRARMRLPGGERIVSKAGIIRLLKSDVYGLSDWMARRVYDDAINFFYSQDGVSPRAWANFYAERLEKWADMAAATGEFRNARSLISDAAKLRGCFDEQPQGIPQELLDASPVVIYTTDPQAMGAPKASRKEIEAFIDSLPDIPEISRRRVREDAGVDKRNMLSRILDDMKEFGDDGED